MAENATSTIPESERQANTDLTRLTQLDPALTLGEALEILADLGANRQLAVISNGDEAPALGAIAIFRGEDTGRYVDAIEACDEAIDATAPQPGQPA